LIIFPHVSDKRAMLLHFLAAIAYRTQKALQDAPKNFGEFRAGRDVRSPTEIVRHMTSVLGYARTYFVGGEARPEPLPTLAEEVERFHKMLAKWQGTCGTPSLQAFDRNNCFRDHSQM
jgi:hypothetical protein